MGSELIQLPICPAYVSGFFFLRKGEGESIPCKDQIVPFSFNIEFCMWVKKIVIFSSRFACS